MMACDGMCAMDAQALAFDMSRARDVAVVGACTGISGFGVLCDCKSVTLVEEDDEALRRLQKSIERNSGGDLDLHRKGENLPELAESATVCHAANAPDASYDLVQVPEPSDDGSDMRLARRIVRPGGTILLASESSLYPKIVGTSQHQSSSQAQADDATSNHAEISASTISAATNQSSFNIQFFTRGEDMSLAQATM